MAQITEEKANKAAADAVKEEPSQDKVAPRKKSTKRNTRKNTQS